MDEKENRATVAGATGCAEMSPYREDVERARARFVDWLRYWLATQPELENNKAELARRMGVSRPTISLALGARTRWAPDFATLVGFHKMTGFPYDVFLRTDAPPLPRRP